MAPAKPNPKHLALSAIAGATLLACAFFVPLAPFHHVLAILPPAIVGATLWLLSYRRFERGFLNDRWTEAELAPVHALLAQPFWAWMGCGLFALSVAELAFSKHGGAFIYLVTCPMNAVTSMRRLLAPPVPRTALIDWQNVKPLHSDHWGEAPRPLSS